MAQPDDLAVRVAAPETQVSDLNQRVSGGERDSAGARILAGGADREVGEIRGGMRDLRQATTSSFNAMRADFTDLRGEVTDLRRHVDDGFAEIRGRLDGAAAGQQQIVDLLTTLIDRQDGQ